MGDDPRHILVLEAGGIGDAVLAGPTLDALRARFPEARLTLVVAPRTRPVVESLRLDAAIRTLRLGQPLGQIMDALALVGAARRGGTDLLVDLSSIETPAAALKRRALVALIGARRSVGRNTNGRGRFFDEAADETLTGPEHEVLRKLAVVAPLGIQAACPTPRVGITPADTAAAAERLAEAGVGPEMELVGINPGSNLRSRRWPVEHFRTLAASLTAEGERALLVTGGPGEEALVDQVAAAAQGPVVLAVGRPLMQAAALIARCRLFVTNDTGLMHVAAALDVPVVALFGRTNLARYQPWLPEGRRILFQQPPTACPDFDPERPWAECRRELCPQATCMSAIAPVAVEDAANRLLRTPAPNRAEASDA